MTADGNPCRKIEADGFTILEILVAMVLTAFGVLGFTGLLKVIGNVEAEDTWETKALFCAQERMEELKFDCLTDKAFTAKAKEIVAEGPYQGMQREWTTGDSSLFEGLLEITVGCGYPWKGTMETVEVSTLVYMEE